MIRWRTSEENRRLGNVVAGIAVAQGKGWDRRRGFFFCFEVMGIREDAVAAWGSGRDGEGEERHTRRDGQIAGTRRIGRMRFTDDVAEAEAEE